MRQFVLDLRRHDGMHGPRDQAVALHLAQRLREHLLADALNQFAQARKAQLTLFRQYFKNQVLSTWEICWRFHRPGQLLTC